MLPVEGPVQGMAFLRAALTTLGAVVRSPAGSFHKCREPVDHGVVVRYLAWLRLPLWLVLLATLAGTRMGEDALPQPLIPIHAFIEPPLARVLSLWIVLMIPVGIPVLYFMSGLLAHLSVSLTGGAPRSIGATMRAVGYAMGPALLLIGILDIPLYLGALEGMPYLAALGLLGVWFLWQAGVALARTHQVAVLRGFLVVLIPTILLVSVTLGRALLVLGEVPFLGPASTSPYYVP